MKRHILSIAVLATMLTVAAQAQDTTQTTPKKKTEQTQKKKQQEVTVYITDTGRKYHREGCRSLKKSAIPISLSEAKKSYDPCKVCSPPE